MLSDSLEHFLNGSGVSKESNSHLKTLWWDITHWWFNVVWNPFNEVRWVLVLHIQHLLVDFFGWHSSSEKCWCSKISSVSWVRCAHHVFGIKHLLSQFWDSQGSVLLRPSWGKWCESSHEEVESWEWNQVDGKLSKIWIKLSWESKAASYSWNGSWDQVVKISISWGCEFQCSEANIIKGFIVNAHNFISILNQLMDWKSSIVWLNDSIWYFGWWHHRECAHYSVWVFLSNFWNQKSSHSWSGTSSKRVSNLESLETIATFCFFSNDVQYWVNQLSTFCVMSFSPVVSSTALSEYEVVRSEQLTEWASSYRVHCAWLQVHKDGSWDVSSSSCFIVIDIDSF